MLCSPVQTPGRSHLLARFSSSGLSEAVTHGLQCLLTTRPLPGLSFPVPLVDTTILLMGSVGGKVPFKVIGSAATDDKKNLLSHHVI